jgi:hypothetical protein
MLVRLAKRRNEHPAGAIVDLPTAEAESLIGFGLAEVVVDVDAEALTRHVERASVKTNTKTAIVPVEAADVAEIVEPEA